MKKKQQHKHYLAVLFFVMALTTGVGIGYVWATGRSIQITGVTNCQFPGFKT